MDNFVWRYRGKAGCEYFASRFTKEQDFGRRYQSRYFAPFCGKDKVLLDFGCGNGTILAELPASKRIGIEVNRECWARVQEMNKSLEIPISLYSDLDSVPDQTVDVVISNHCLEHVPRPLDTLKEIKRVLVAEGDLILVVPFDDWRSRKNGRWVDGDRDFHLYTWSPMNIGNLLKEAGFTVCRISLQTFAWTPRLFCVYRHLGNTCFKIACGLFSRVKNHREILCVCRKPFIGA